VSGEFHRSRATIAEFGELRARDRILPEPAPATKVDLIYSMMRTQRMLSSQLSKAFTPYGVSWAGYEIMQLLVHSGRDPISILALARHLKRHWTSIAHTLNGLERAGHVTRYQNPDYWREKLVELTDSGYEAWVRVSEALAETADLCSPDDHTALGLLAGLSAFESELRKPSCGVQ